MDLNDELLCAYLDNELDADRTAAGCRGAGRRCRRAAAPAAHARCGSRAARGAAAAAAATTSKRRMAARIQGRCGRSWRRTRAALGFGRSGRGPVRGLPAAASRRTRAGGLLQLVQLAPAMQALLETRAGGESAARSVSIVLTFQAAGCALLPPVPRSWRVRSRVKAWPVAAARAAGSSPPGMRPARLPPKASGPPARAR